MKRRTKILIGIGVLGGLVGANLWYRKSKATKAAEVSAIPATTTTDAPATTSTARTRSTKSTIDFSKLFPRVSSYPQTFRNRVFTKVQDFHGVKVSTWDKSKTLALYQRIGKKLEAKGIALEKATLGQIGPVLKEIGTEGFPFKTEMAQPRATVNEIGLPLGRPEIMDREDWA